MKKRHKYEKNNNRNEIDSKRRSSKTWRFIRLYLLFFREDKEILHTGTLTSVHEESVAYRTVQIFVAKRKRKNTWNEAFEMFHGCWISFVNSNLHIHGLERLEWR